MALAPVPQLTRWNTSDNTINGDWILSTNRMNVNSGRSNAVTYNLTYISSAYSWKANKTYQFKTTTVSFYATASRFSITPPWVDQLGFNQANGTTASTSPGSNNQYFYHYSSPNSDVYESTYATYRASASFNSATGILGLTATEIDFGIQGFSYYKLAPYELTNPSFLGTSQSHVSLGWLYNKDQDVYFWYDSSTNKKYPVGGTNGLKSAKSGFRRNNYISKFIQYSNFNITFNYQNISNHPVNIYLSTTLPSNNPEVFSPPVGSILLGTLTQSVSTSGATSLTSSISQAFYGLRGNKYIYFVGPYVGATTSATYSGVYISNIKVEGGYHSGNNRQYLLTNSAVYSNPTTLSPIGLTGATYSANVGQGNSVNNTVSTIFSKIGNGTFKSGIWENGVWNSGWRVDDGMYEFYDVFQHFSYNRLKKWRVQIQGPTSSVSKFEIGDNISIGNIVAIDINDDRRLLKNYFTIINKTDDTIIVEFDNNFPLRRIKRDSENHRIYVTKNVWLSGGFLNGYFKGIWNYGLFKGYPLITEMYDSHWIDGVFDGGHFNTVKYPSITFSDTLYYGDSDNIGYVGLTFSSKHNLVANDIITIDKNPIFNEYTVGGLINDQYNGEHTVKYIINDYHVVIDQEWGSNTSNESGTASVNKSKGVIQKMSFKSNNKSRITSIQSDQSANVFTFNSWIDVNYDDSSAVNIQKPQTLINEVSNKSYSENNLYGYPTLDVLESDSIFRDSFSTTVRKYRLGTKYKIFADYIGDSGNFEEYFTQTAKADKVNEFISKGWTFSTYTASNIAFSRTEDNGIYPLIGQELRIKATKGGGILDITPFSEEEVLNKTYAAIEKSRYTKIEFDLITFSNTGNYGAYFGSSDKNIYNEIAIPAFFEPSGDEASAGSVNLTDYYYYWFYGANEPFYNLAPSLHFNNLNVMKRDVYYPPIPGEGITESDGTGESGTYSTYVPATFLPINKNVNHLNTKKINKKEYFFNKRNLSMVFHGYYSQNSLVAEYIIDNLHFYEVDMIPFFQYFTEDTINKGVEIPFQGISPFIDYSNANFNFIDNIAIGLDSIQTQNSNTAVSGIGGGIGGGVSGGIGGNIGVIYEQAAPNNLLLLVQGPSDIRLKTNINKIGVSNNGINIYEFRFINQPNDLYQGVIAQELIGTEFESATRIESDGYYHVDYSKLDVEFKKIN